MLSRLALIALALAGSEPSGNPQPLPPAGKEEQAAPPALAANEAKTAAGLVVSADLHDEYLAGFPALVAITVRNDSNAAQTFPDLAARPHLVRFAFDLAGKKSERYNTPPAIDPGTTWSIPPRSQRRVLLEIPSSGAMRPGAATLTVTVADPAGPIALPAKAIRIAEAKPVAASVVTDPTIQATAGQVVPWLHQAAKGFDLYAMHMSPKAPGRVQAQYHLLHLDKRVEPVLSRSRAPDAMSRYVYWQAGPQTVTLARLDGSALAGKPRTVSSPWPKIELLGRGATDAKGGAIVPVWIPAPKGEGGNVRAMCVDERGALVIREVALLPRRPDAVATAVDAAGNLVIALGHAAGVDLYKVDPSLAPEMSAKGARVTKLADGWRPEALAFDSLPDTPERPGGLALLAVLESGDGASYRTLWADLAGKVFAEATARPWKVPGELDQVLPSGLGPFYWYAKDENGAWWYGAEGGPPAKIADGGPGALWADTDAIKLRRVVAGRVIEDRTMGPKQP
ncbi:MAG: hypothetical protein ACOZNI_16900 [Myxococcota bacterium]